MESRPQSHDYEQSKAFVARFTIEPYGSGSLSGLRFAVKDLIDVGGHKTGCGNPSWRASHPPAAANAVCVDQLLSSGAECVGKTVTDELAFSINGENDFYGTPLNPKAPDRVPGGSSSGSASAVACGLVDFALGTDTGGSVRVPASNCGIFGIRPTHGTISVAGVNPLAPSFDTVGILARDEEVLAKAASVLLACDVPKTVKVGTIHVLADAFEIAEPRIRQEMTRPVELLKSLFPSKVRNTSAQEITSEPPQEGLKDWYEVYCPVQWAEIWSCLGSWVAETNPELGPRIKRNFELVKSLDRTTIGHSTRRRELYYRRLKEFLGPQDLICMPTTPFLAPPKGSLGIDRTMGHYYPRTLSFTAIAGIGRLPQVSMPLPDLEGVPIGLSLVAAQGMDAFLLTVVREVVSRRSLIS